MRLFHVSEDADIEIFHPRIPARSDLDKNVGLVWAIDEERLPNFLTPRDAGLGLPLEFRNAPCPNSCPLGWALNNQYKFISEPCATDKSELT